VTHDASVAARAKRQIGFEDGRIVLDKVLRA
jgi:predicted ABC-type transport system involved in lysophospholipase L1 biosynthesis ATPase subunit